MMNLAFTKFSGAGNDFIAVDNMDSSLNDLLNEDFIRRICRRGMDVGADGLLELASDPEFSFRMRYYNNDGKTASMCGNGGRCIVRFASEKGLAPESGRFLFRSDAGVHLAELTEPDRSRIWMTDPSVHFLEKRIKAGPVEYTVSLIDTGVPHAVIFTVDDGIVFDEAAPVLRSHPAFGKAGANVDFIYPSSGSKYRIRTWERGVERETLACGTGAVACALCANALLDAELPHEVTVKSGEVLGVGKDDSGWWLEGEARIVYTGIIHLP